MKKAQVSLFIIIGILVVFSAGVVIYVAQIQKEPEITRVISPLEETKEAAKIGCVYNNPPCRSNEDCISNECFPKKQEIIGCKYNNPSCASDEDCVSNDCIKKTGCKYNNPACKSGYICQNNECIKTCQDECTAGQNRCQANIAETCETGGNDCNHWINQTCGNNEYCSSGSCIQQQPPSYNMKVLVIKYFPTRVVDGEEHIDLSVTGDVGESYQFIRQKTIDVTNNLAYFLTQATKYLGHKNPNAKPSLGYEVVDLKEYKQAVPMKPGTRDPDYISIMQSHNICHYVDDLGVSEVWMFAYQGPSDQTHPNGYLHIWESQMSSPQDSKAANGPTDLTPICQHTYRLYTFNYQRGTAEAMESWGHQIEAETKQIGLTLFRDIWQGPYHPQATNENGRCGSVHNPPNARSEYDRGNPQPQASDCLDWNPDGLGTLSQISCQNWGCSGGTDFDNPALNYMIWNWQNLPGYQNTKTYQGKQLTNWWEIHADWDAAITQNKNLTV